MTQTNNNTEKISLATDVLVIGGGHTGYFAASKIADAGYNVILTNSDETKKQPQQTGLQELADRANNEARIQILNQARIVNATGMAGDFTVRLSTDDETKEHHVGAIVAATEIYTQPLHDDYGLSLSETVTSLSELEGLLTDDNKKKTLENKSIAVLTGFTQEGDPLVMRRILNCVKAICQIDGCMVYVYINNIKVSENGLERLYKEGRDSGAVYFKLTEKPIVKNDGEKVTISFFDPVLRSDVELAPDAIVMEEGIFTDDQNRSLGEILRIDTDASGFLQMNNVHRFPVNSNREGIYIIGTARKPQNLAACFIDAGNAVTEIKNLLGDGIKTVPASMAVVDREKCAVCLTCYRCCPHGAIYWDDKAVISPLACQGCGICASECPMDAIQLVGYTDTELSASIKEAVTPSKDAPKIVAFCCENSAFEAGEAAKAFNVKLPDGLRMIKVPCAGKIDISYILNAFVEGADGVLVMACHQGNCKSEFGSTYARWRVNDAYRMLEEIGLNKNQLEFVTLASNCAADFAKFATGMEKRIS